MHARRAFSIVMHQVYTGGIVLESADIRHIIPISYEAVSAETHKMSRALLYIRIIKGPELIRSH